MNHQQKEQIVKAAIDYSIAAGWAKGNSTGVNQLAQFSKVNVSYLSRILNKEFTYHDNKAGKDQPIADHWFIQLAESIGYKQEKEYWPHMETPQYQDMIMELDEALLTSGTRVIICDSGFGKTYTSKRFQKQNPNKVFIVTCSSLDCPRVIAEKLMEAIGKNFEERNLGRLLTRINAALYSMGRYNGQKPMVIFDEAENLKLPGLQMLKTMYDTLNWTCSLVLIGTDQLIQNIEKLKHKNKIGMPQFYRRFKAGIRFIDQNGCDYDLVLKNRGFSPALKKLIKNQCCNYGEIHDFLVPALKEADMLCEPLTDDLFRMKYRLQHI